MRITDIALSTPLVGGRPASARRTGSGSGPAVVTTSSRAGLEHPDQVAASALSRAAALAQASKVVAASNDGAAASVRGDLLDLTRVP